MEPESTISLSEIDLNNAKRVGLEFDFDEDIIDRVRELPGRKWWPEEKIWHIPFRTVVLVLERQRCSRS